MSAAHLHSSSLLGDPRLRRDLVHTIQRRTDRLDVDDVVQATLAEALAAKALPSVVEEVRPFVFAIAQQKIADLYRRRARERRLSVRVPQPLAIQPGHDTLYHLRAWVARTLPDAASVRQTFAWMLREAEGETLAEIAAADQVSVPMVRQRVSRLRRWLRARWATGMVGATVLALLALAAVLARSRGPLARSVDEVRADPFVAPPRSPVAPQPAGGVERPVHRFIPPPAPLRHTPMEALPPLKAASSRHTEERFSASGKRVSVTHYEVTLPRIDVRSCATASSSAGVSHIALSFKPDGSLDSALVDSGAIAGRPEARCVERLYARVTVRPFTEGPVVAGTYFTLVPAELPSWLTKSQEGADAGN